VDVHAAYQNENCGERANDNSRELIGLEKKRERQKDTSDNQTPNAVDHAVSPQRRIKEVHIKQSQEANNRPTMFQNGVAWRSINQIALGFCAKS